MPCAHALCAALGGGCWGEGKLGRDPRVVFTV